MSEAIIGFLAISGVILWLIVLTMPLRKDTKHPQQGNVVQERPGNYVCMAKGCQYEGFVLSFCGDWPTCPHCGSLLASVAGTFWALEKRVMELEAKP